MATSKELRILHFGRFWNENYGGLERIVMLMLVGLNREPGVVADNLVAADRLKSEVQQLPEYGYRVFRVASFGVFASLAMAPAMIWQARRLIRREGYQIAHLHFPDPLSALCALFFPKGTRIVVTWHSDIIRQQWLRKLLAPLLNHVIRRAEYIFAATPKHFSSSTQLGAVRDPERRLTVVPFGFPLDDYAATLEVTAAAQRLRESWCANRPSANPGTQAETGTPPAVLFAVGRHIYYKGFEYLIRALSELPDALLVLGGRGPLTAGLRELADELGVADRVVFPGRIPDEELVHYYHACDIFCMPSVAPSEAFGIVQVEAMACGKPVVCCELDNGVTYVNRHEESGLVVPPCDPVALAAALQRLLGDSALRKRLGQQAYEWVHSEFSLERMTAASLRRYRELIEN